MTQRNSMGASPAWLGAEGGSGDLLGGGEMWVAHHAGDDDLLVFDPAEAGSRTDVVSFYSLAKHRRRTFPRAMIGSQITPVTDEASSARALEDYARRAELEAELVGEREADRSAQAEQLRESVIEAHQRYLEGLGVDYVGVERTDGNRKAGRRTKCPACGIALDDFAHAVCAACGGVLCSCGACSCGVVPRGR